MCGRISLLTPPERLARIFDAVLAAGVDPVGRSSANVGPTRMVPGLAGAGGPAQAEDVTEKEGRVLDVYKWGLVPSWADNPSIGSRLFNARAETVATKPSFRSAFAHRRLAVLADGFYEWHGEHGRRQPYYFTRADRSPLAFAGLWEEWRGPAPGVAARPLRSCTIITSAAGADMAGLHDRMPVGLDPAAIDVWLEADGKADRDLLESMLVPGVPGTLVHHPVSAAVGNVRNDDPELVEPVDPD